MKYKNQCLTFIFTLLLITFLLNSLTFAQIGKQTEKPNSGENKLSDFQNPTETFNLDEQNHYKYIFSGGIKNFIEEINKAGKQGYKLQYLTKYPLNVGEDFSQMTFGAIVMKDDKNTFEYDWFEAFSPGEITTRINYRAKNGFYYRDSLGVTQGLCENNSDYSPDKSDTEKIFDGLIDQLRIFYGKIYILERKNGEQNPKEYRVAIGTLGWKSNLTGEIENELNNIVEQGFEPVDLSTHKIVNKYAISVLLEKDQAKPTTKNNLTYKFVRSEFGFEKKINNLAKDGFKIFSGGNFVAVRFALMIKNEQLPKNIAYEWTSTLQKSYQSKLANLSKNGGKFYKIISQSYACDSIEGRFLFEKFPEKNANSPNYEILKIETDLLKDGEKIQYPLKLSLNNETKRKFNEILNQGFVIREMFYDDGINILFER